MHGDGEPNSLKLHIIIIKFGRGSVHVQGPPIQGQVSIRGRDVSLKAQPRGYRRCKYVELGRAWWHSIMLHQNHKKLEAESGLGEAPW